MKIALVKCCSTLLLAFAASALQPATQPPKEHSHSTPEVFQEEIGSRYSGNFVIGRISMCTYYRHASQ